MLMREMLAGCGGLTSGLVGIGGPGAAGKSTLAAELADALVAQGRSACILGIDCYLRDRVERAALHPPVSGYDPAAYRLGDASVDIADLRAGRAVTVRDYDKVLGRRGDPVLIRPASILIVEGSMALRAGLSDLCDLALYLFADPRVLFEHRCRRELAMGFSRAEIDDKYGKLLPDYEAHVRPQAGCADLLAQIDRHHRVISISLPERTSGGERERVALYRENAGCSAINALETSRVP